MRYFTLTLAVLLAGCMSEKNPLESQDPKALAQIIFDSVRVSRKCAKVWANPDAANAQVLGMCDMEAFKVADTLGQKGYGNVTSPDIRIPAIWAEFLVLKKARKAKQKEDMKDMFKLDPEVEARAKAAQEARRKRAEEYMRAIKEK